MLLHGSTSYIIIKKVLSLLDSPNNKNCKFIFNCWAYAYGLEKALLVPLIKKITDDPEILKNFRPISNLPFLSKLIERVVADQIISHMSSNGLDEIFQSSYKKFHSTETALNCVLDDILCGIDDKKCALLLVLDMSSGFDTVDHNIVIQRLKKRIGLRGNVLNWFK